MIAVRTNPDTIAERARPQTTLLWDKVTDGLWSLVLNPVLPLVANPDMGFDWTGELSAARNLAGAAGLGLGSSAMIAHTHSSTVARL